MPGYASQSAPSRRYLTVTPSDAADLPQGICRALYVGGGNVSLVSPAGDTVLFVDVVGVLPVQVARVRATGTTATNIVALY